MGWVGAGSLIVITTYFLYRYSLRSTSNSASALRTDSPAPPADEPSPPEVGSSSPPTLDHDKETPETTPKALTPSAPALTLSVPVLNLDGDIATVAPEPLAPRSMSGPSSSPAGHNGEASETKAMPPPPLPSSSVSQPPQQSQPSSPNSANALMPPPSVPRLRPTAQPTRPPPAGQLQPPRFSSGGSLAPPPSAASGLRVPTNAGSRLSSSTLAPTQVKKASASRKVILEPGYSPLDWAALTSNPNNQLRGVGLPPVLRVTPSMLKAQNGRKGRDAWTSYQGRVYNISPYLPYHPGGKGELLRGAGKDSAQLFQEIHPWVNWDGILNECMVGILVSEDDIQAENSLDAMD
ncbi:hypothetical protein N7492_008915 [Penicillium capsulatum]|uniref:Cytochrome b5 heme-binding domain-containing protein n=1 Tax=Penicillium capsulatum TaxID=69766 RepID=A0A9W9HSW6_9EURO|nr:hypothetical protein N7492_008915 [Penicillium capsulatum]KAJ6106315.1 hypothetical protein N7512_009832 [Penicillium capsulatum]